MLYEEPTKIMVLVVDGGGPDQGIADFRTAPTPAPAASFRTAGPREGPTVTSDGRDIVRASTYDGLTFPI